VRCSIADGQVPDMIAASVRTHRRASARAAVAASLLVASWSARAALSDEIQVYTNDINAPGVFGLETHINTTPQGRDVPDYPGEVTPRHGLRITPEFSYGLTPSWEAGLYVPTDRTAGNDWAIAGAKLRLKWLPIRGDDSGHGWFAGANGELSRLRQRFSASRNAFELRTIGGYQNERWLFAVNPVFAWDLSSGYRGHAPDFSLGLKAARTVAEGVALGLEYYSDLGPLSHTVASNRQDNALYIAADFDWKTFSLNLGVGRGLTSVADKLTVKAILGFAF
jgi:hypothetical protein